MSTIDCAVKCEIRSVIRFLWAEGHNAADIHRTMGKVHGKIFMSDSKVRNWCREFGGGRTDVHDEGGQGRWAVATDDAVSIVDDWVRNNRRLTISELSYCNASRRRRGALGSRCALVRARLGSVGVRNGRERGSLLID